MATSEQRREELKAVFEQARGCTLCAELAATRTQVVFGAGNADADLMLVGEAPGANEDRQGRPFVGQAGKLLDQLLGEIGLRRADVFVANTLKCLERDAPVQLGDGSWERIGRLVRSRYSGTVMSVDDAGQLVPRRVTGWHATPLAGRSVFRLSVRSARPGGVHRAGVQLTGDHPVLTRRGYVPAADLRDGDRVATATRGLSEMIAPHVAPSMRHQPQPEAEAAVPSGLGRLRAVPSSVLFDAVDVEDVTDRPRHDRTFFCIDVEDTHNFVTSGGVVHNCRPPGNRDPHPAEIESCQRYLLRQLELIEPRVVCTLGNFATKLLRGDPAGITRVHGRDEVRTIGRRAVRLYPIFHPAAALYTPRMLEALRGDFARIPELLALPAPPQPEVDAALGAPIEPEDAPRATPAPAAELQPPRDDQLGLF